MKITTGVRNCRINLAAIGVIISAIALLLSLGAAIGTAYVLRYRVERLEKDFIDLIVQLRSNAMATQALTVAISTSSIREERIDDHEDRLRELENGKRVPTH